MLLVGTLIEQLQGHHLHVGLLEPHLSSIIWWHHQASSGGTIKHHQVAPSNTIKHHQASSSIIRSLFKPTAMSV